MIFRLQETAIDAVSWAAGKKYPAAPENNAERPAVTVKETNIRGSGTMATIMKFLLSALLLTLPAFAQDYKIAVIGLVHSHVWGHLDRMIKGDPAKLVGITETEPELIAEAKKAGLDRPDL